MVLKQSLEDHLRYNSLRMNFIHLELLVVCDKYRKSRNSFNRFPEIPFNDSLRSNPSCHTLSKTFDISKKTPLTSSPSSDDLYIS